MGPRPNHPQRGSLLDERSWNETRDEHFSRTSSGYPDADVTHSLNSLGCCSSSPPIRTMLFSFTQPVKLECERNKGEDGERRRGGRGGGGGGDQE